MKQYDTNQIAKIISLLLLIAFLFLSSGFVVGIIYQSNKNNKSEVKIEKNPDNINANNIINNDLNQVNNQFVASKNSDIFYNINCSGANKIKEKNRVYFATKDQAIKNGFKFSSTCKP